MLSARDIAENKAKSCPSGKAQKIFKKKKKLQMKLSTLEENRTEV